MGNRSSQDPFAEAAGAYEKLAPLVVASIREILNLMEMNGDSKLERTWVQFARQYPNTKAQITELYEITARLREGRRILDEILRFHGIETGSAEATKITHIHFLLGYDKFIAQVNKLALKSREQQKATLTRYLESPLKVVVRPPSPEDVARKKLAAKQLGRSLWRSERRSPHPD